MGEGPRGRRAKGRAGLKLGRGPTAALAVAALWTAFIAIWKYAPLTLTVDDSFYYFQIAKHVFAGDGVTFDGWQETTGFHPLWLLVLAPLGGLLDRAPDFAVRLILLGQLAIAGASVFVLARTKSGERGRVFGVVAALALAFNFTKIFVNGMESALEFLLLALAIALAEKEEEPGRRRTMLLGLVCGLLCLARLSAFPGAATLLAVALRRRGAPSKDWLWPSLLLVGPVVLYSLFLYQRTGHPFPISAAIKYGHRFWPWHGALGTALVLVPAAAAVAIVMRAEWQGRSAPIWLAPLAIWIVAQLACDAVVRWMLIPEVWYLVPHATLAILGICELTRYRAKWAKDLLAAAALTGAAIWPLRLRAETYSFYVEAKQVGGWLAANTPPESRVAGWDCGIAAFYSNRPLSNLDGLASSWTYKLEFLDQHRIRAFLDTNNVNYVAQYVPEREALVRFHGVDLSDWEVVYERPYEFRGILVWLEGPTRHRYMILRRRQPRAIGT